MVRSTRFPAAVHVLAMLALKPGESFSSAFIAKSLATNSVVVRRLLARLQKAGLVVCQPGVHGGAKLIIDPNDVTLLDVYDCVEARDIFRVHRPQPNCPVACSVQTDLKAALARAELTMREELAQIRLSNITQRASSAYKEWSSARPRGLELTDS